jgi:hypothetical protein
VKDTLTGRPVRRIPGSGVLPGTSVAGSSAVFSLDSRHLLVYRTARDGPDQTRVSVDLSRWRLWDQETGDETALPPELVAADPAADMVLGPGAAWLVWLRVPRSRPGEWLRPPVEVTYSRWDRAANRVTASRFSIGRDDGRPALSPDGGTVYWQPQPPGVSRQFAEGEPLAPVLSQVDYRPWYECWDVTKSEPVRRFEPVRLPRYSADQRLLAGASLRTALVFNRAGTMAAYRTATEVVVYRVSDGTEHARFPLPGTSERMSGPERARTDALLLSDDGNRIVVGLKDTYHVAERTADGTAGRLIRYSAEENLLSPPSFSRLMPRLQPGGKTLIGLDVTTPVARVWDVSRDRVRFEPLQAAPRNPVRDGPQTRQFTSSDGRVTLEWTVRRETRPDTALPPVIVGGGPIVVQVGGKVLGSITDWADVISPTPLSLGGGRRLLVDAFIRPTTEDRTITPGMEWRLYDLEGGLRKIESGPGSLVSLPGTPYLVERTASPFSFVQRPAGLPIDRHTALRHLDTGEVVRRLELPGRTLHLSGFDPTGRTFLVESTDTPLPAAGPTRRRYATADYAVAGAGLAAVTLRVGRPAPLAEGPRSLRVHLFDTATGREIWARDVAPGSFAGRTDDARFTPDGKRVLARYTASRVGSPQGRDRLWVAGADGTVEHDLTVHEQAPSPSRTRSLVGLRGVPASDLTVC